MLEHPLFLRRALLASALGLALPAAAFAQCPATDLVSKQILEVFKRPIEVKKISPTPVKGLCEIQVSFQGQVNLLYTDATGSHFLIGQLIEANGGRNLTEETLGALKSLSAEDMKKVDALVAMSLGTKGPKVYFVTDPMWPYCKRAGAALKELADKGEIQVKVLMFPLPMHQGARDQCVAVICDKKGFEDLENGYKSDNKCAEGAKLVDDTIALLSSKGITGTPTYLFEDGRYQSGVLEADALRQRLGLPTATKKAPAAAPAKK